MNEQTPPQRKHDGEVSSPVLQIVAPLYSLRERSRDSAGVVALIY